MSRILITALYVFVFGGWLPVVIGVGALSHLQKVLKEKRIREFSRVVRFPSILARVEPTPWQLRQTPTDLAAAYAPPASLPLTVEPAPAPFTEEPRRAIETAEREQFIDATVEVDDYGCPMPCTARHCIYHAGIVGSIAQRWRWNTDTAEWSLLGLKVPDFPPLWMAVFEEAT
jgi:hypothetical protein